MPVDTSNALCDLTQFDVFKESASEFYSKYYLKRDGFPKGTTKITDTTPENLVFDQSLNIEHRKTFPKIVFLGTVSAKASSYRNNTSILVHNT